MELRDIERNDQVINEKEWESEKVIGGREMIGKMKNDSRRICRPTTRLKEGENCWGKKMGGRRLVWNYGMDVERMLLFLFFLFSFSSTFIRFSKSAFTQLHNFKVVILKFILNILNFKIGNLSFKFDKL